MTATLDIQNTPDALVVRLRRKGEIDGFHLYTTGILSLGLLVIAAFIYKSMVADGVVVIQVLFVLIGAYGLLLVYRRLRGLWLFHAGGDTVEIKEGLFTFSSAFWIWRRRLVMRVADIQGVELVESPFPSIRAVTGWRAETSAGVIRVWRSKGTQCFLGQFLKVEERAGLFDALSKRLKPLMQVA